MREERLGGILEQEDAEDAKGSKARLRERVRGRGRPAYAGGLNPEIGPYPEPSPARRGGLGVLGISVADSWLPALTI